MSKKPVAFVSGGAGGLGESCARMLAEDYTVAIGDVNMEAAETVAGEIGGIAVRCDVGDAASVATCVATIEDRVGPIDAFAHYAGVIQDRRYPPEEFDQDYWDLIVNVNARGTWLACKEVGSRMALRHRGSIVTIASVAGHRSWPTLAYGPSKAFVLHLTKSLSSEWGKSGLRVNSVTPGFTLTPKMKEIQARKGWSTETIAKQMPIDRWLEPDEISHAVCFLLSDKASGITGIDLTVDGGWLAGINWNSHAGLPKSR